MRYESSGGDSVVWADTNGDGVADLGLQLIGVTSLAAGDFIF
nr:hypothetical protein [Sphingomonas rhizophila]